MPCLLEPGLRVRPWVSAVLHLTLSLGFAASAAAQDVADAPVTPPPDGLVVWLDAADPGLKVGRDGRVTTWNSRRPARLPARPDTPDLAPAVVADAFGPGLPAVRFDGNAALELPAPARGPGDLTVFVVYQRADASLGGPKWQRLVSAWDGESPNDLKGGSLAIAADDHGGAAEPMIRNGSFSGVARGPLTVGRNQRYGANPFHGDVAELLVYDRGFLVDEQFRQVEDYLAAKWGVARDARDDWTRKGLLGDVPARETDDLPLSDQANAGKWKRFAPLSDAFDRGRLDARRWYDHNPNWYGRAPALFLPENVEVADGELRLTMRHAPGMSPVTHYRDSVYDTFTSASVVGKTMVLYGYFEIEAQAMASAGSSAWWFASKLKDGRDRVSRTEIDVFELGGRAAGHERQFHMNAHVFETPEGGKDKFNRGGTWDAPFAFAESFHVFGLEWNPDEIVWYVDGVPVRRMPNTHWHTPLRMIFDSETMGNWLGLPDPADLPSVFRVRYVRAWKNAATRGDLRRSGFQIPDVGETNVTKWLRGYRR